MKFFVVALVAVCASSALAQLNPEPQYAPIPYQFAYKAETDEGSHSQEETSDVNGRRQGSYTMTLADGRQRTVNYVADENGFRAEVSTNELGTESKDAADVRYSSSALTGEEAALKYGPAAPVQTPVQKVRLVQAPTPVVKVAPVLKVAAPAPTFVKAVHTTPVVRAFAAPTVVKTFAAPTVVKTVQTAPVHYAVAHQPAVHVATAHAPVAYATHTTAAAGPSFIQFKLGEHAAHEIHLHETHHKSS